MTTNLVTNLTSLEENKNVIGMAINIKISKATDYLQKGEY